MVQVYEVAARAKLRVALETIDRLLHHAGRYTAPLQPMHEFVAILGLRIFCHQTIEFVLVGFAANRSPEAFLSCPIRRAHFGSERLPLGIRLNSDCDPFVVAATWIRAMRRPIRV